MRASPGAFGRLSPVASPGELAFQLEHFAFPRKTWAAPHQSEAFPAGLCLPTLGCMMVPTAASSTPNTAASTRALLCVAPGPTV